MDDAQLRAILSRLEPGPRNSLRRVLIGDQERRDQTARTLLRHATDESDSLADLIDMLTIDADSRRRVVRLLGELAARG